jgi:hypothetical protein
MFGNLRSFCHVSGTLIGLGLVTIASAAGPTADGSATHAAAASAPLVVPRDTLVYKDGDRVFGKLIGKDGDIIVFKSDRFGELRVPSADAVVVPAEKNDESASAVAKSKPATGVAAAPSPEQEKATEKKEAEAEKVSGWEHLSPFVLTAEVRRYFGPWHGKVAFTAESVSDTSRRQNDVVEAKLQRKWAHDEVQTNANYTFSKTNGLTTTDLVKSDGSWRHDFPDNYFAAYRPTLEWNRAYSPNNVPSNYVLLQQEIGGGVTLVKSPANQVRAGLSENVFTNWVLPTDTHLTKYVESAFVEVESKLPWRVTLSDRTVYYYAFATRKDGFENKFAVDKKFTETISIGLHYEVRYNNPDVRSADYNLLRLVFGLDF